ncbi:MAG: AmmeMemoRadiSam system protein A, partial [Thermodesulfobacteriota bacterium]|nr:AmmeMemoRadiSam system protein A [Thermodesulfobacteriota bacterium]
LVSPHAGYVYSGIVAAAGYRQVDPSFKTVILLGPSHRFPLRGASTPNVKAYQTPLGDVPLAKLAFTLQDRGFVGSVAQAHSREHSLEVQLPFLKVILGDFQIVPILTNDADPEALAATLAPHIGEETLVVASSDLSHYHSYEKALGLDRLFTTAVPALRFSETAQCEACGKQAVLTLMHIAKIKGWKGLLIDYKNSGDTAGRKDQVVGYASIAFVERKEALNRMKETLPTKDRRALLRLARSAIEAKLVKGAKVERPDPLSPALQEVCGCFVTLHKHGRLRGCIGSIEPLSPLVECVESNAKSAAFRDPRFPPLSREELAHIDIEVSVLSVPQRLDFTDGEDLKRQLEPLVHGVILSRGFNRSTFLPQVWKQLPDKEQFLGHLCQKGGMGQQAWQDRETKVEVYEAEVFGEEDVK